MQAPLHVTLSQRLPVTGFLTSTPQDSTSRPHMRILLAERTLGGDAPTPWIVRFMEHTKIIYIKPVIVADGVAMPGIEYLLQSPFDWNPFPL